MDFSHAYSHSMDLKKGKLLLPIAVARVLGIATNQYKPNPLVEVLNPSFSLAEEKIVDIEYIGIAGSTSAKFHFPTIYSKNIWNYISTNSFQSLYFYSDQIGQRSSSLQRQRFTTIYDSIRPELQYTREENQSASTIDGVEDAQE